MSEQVSQQVPETGNPVIDAALRGVGDPEETPLAEQVEQLTAAQEVLAEALNQPQQ